MREEMERLQREKRDRAPARSSSGVRGVRGTRASVRAGAAARGGSRTGTPFLPPLVLRVEICKNADVFFFFFHTVLGSVSSTVVGHTKAPSGPAAVPSKIARPSSVAVSSARGTTSIPRGVSKRP
jgi:hypothetical protein